MTQNFDVNNGGTSSSQLEEVTCSQNESPQLTQEQLSRIDKNRKRALDIKKSKESQVKVYV